ncbi:MAG: hypothetical protein K9W46_11090 [Candidatus Heimdallarchaeum endolithica]|uniref:Uncharacterized protein n=1 Tax=Candidatus Heimdallarchaeum endolithica TaxID=2876572 RepID=A0A9Y1FMY8_9ARCH|nr:MAG: hypothetical protein K9W46_11090 [Candidatus Heimdallarchaeum endolithica]
MIEIMNNNHLLKGEQQIDNCLSPETLVHPSNHSSFRVLETILSLISFGEVITLEEVSFHLKEKYNVDDPFYLNSSITYLLARGIIKRVRINDKNGLRVVSLYEWKK